ncbi:MAG: DNA-directed RNA polymerase subunit alpha C-terminal domain-containing protein [Alphaproteobacteria bacterium]|nr:DNA-directed RNA polymerase subunit alpha C-terminal domain-containing protein [Alphaproteobacteria bacterium]
MPNEIQNPRDYVLLASAYGVDPDLLSTSLGDLIVNVRAANALDTAGIGDFGKLVQLSADELLGVRHMRRTEVREVQEALNEEGLALGMKLPSELRAITPEGVVVVREMRRLFEMGFERAGNAVTVLMREDLNRLMLDSSRQYWRSTPSSPLIP